MKKYIKKPEIISATQYTGDNLDEIVRYFGMDVIKRTLDVLYIKTGGYWRDVQINDYIVRNEKFGIEVYDNEVFNLIFQEFAE